jgi:hypothetical protein
MKRYTVKKFAFDQKRCPATVRRWIDEGKIIVSDRDERGSQFW